MALSANPEPMVGSVALRRTHADEPPLSIPRRKPAKPFRHEVQDTIQAIKVCGWRSVVGGRPARARHTWGAGLSASRPMSHAAPAPGPTPGGRPGVDPASAGAPGVTAHARAPSRGADGADFPRRSESIVSSSCLFSARSRRHWTSAAPAAAATRRTSALRPDFQGCALGGEQGTDLAALVCASSGRQPRGPQSGSWPRSAVSASPAAPSFGGTGSWTWRCSRSRSALLHCCPVVAALDAFAMSNWTALQATQGGGEGKGAEKSEHLSQPEPCASRRPRAGDHPPPSPRVRLTSALCGQSPTPTASSLGLHAAGPPWTLTARRYFWLAEPSLRRVQLGP